MSAKVDALELIKCARDKWAAGDIDHALEFLDAASARLDLGGVTRADMPTAFGLIDTIRNHLLARAT